MARGTTFRRSCITGSWRMAHSRSGAQHHRLYRLMAEEGLYPKSAAACTLRRPPWPPPGRVCQNAGHAHRLRSARLAPPPVTTYARYVLGVLVVVYVFNFLDRQIISILAEQIRRDLEVTDAQLGFLYGTAFAVFFAMFGIPPAASRTRGTGASWIAIGLAAWSTMTASGFARTFPELAAARIGVGVGERLAGRLLAPLGLVPGGAARHRPRHLLERHLHRGRPRARRRRRRRRPLGRRGRHRRRSASAAGRSRSWSSACPASYSRRAGDAASRRAA